MIPSSEHSPKNSNAAQPRFCPVWIRVRGRGLAWVYTLAFIPLSEVLRSQRTCPIPGRSILSRYQEDSEPSEVTKFIQIVFPLIKISTHYSHAAAAQPAAYNIPEQ